MTTTQYLRAFARFWWLITVCVVIGAILSAVVSSRTAVDYTSSTSILVSGTPVTQPSTIDAYQITLLAQERMATYNDIASSAALAEKVLEGLDAGISATYLTEHTTTAVRDKSTVLRISIQDTDKDRARLMASRAGEAMVAIINRLEKQQAQVPARLKAKVVSEASAPVVYGTTAWRNPLLGGAGGLLVGLALAVAISRLDPRLRDPDIISAQVGAPILGLVPRARRSRSPQERAEGSRYDDAVREVRTGIFFLRKDTDKCLTVAITSPSPVVGASRITSSIARALAATGGRVLVVETELSDTDNAESLLQHDEASGVDVLPAVPASGHGTDLPQAQGLATLLQDAAERYDYVLVNSPTTSPGTDAAAIAARCDVTVLFVGSNTREKQLREGLRQLKGVHADVSGVVLVA